MVKELSLLLRLLVLPFSHRPLAPLFPPCKTKLAFVHTTMELIEVESPSVSEATFPSASERWESSLTQPKSAGLPGITRQRVGLPLNIFD